MNYKKDEVRLSNGSDALDPTWEVLDDHFQNQAF